MKEKGLLKFCPSCKTPTFKHDGCSKMTCTRCNIKWCWLCCKTEIDYDHYNSNNASGCSNRLWEGANLNEDDDDIENEENE